MFQYYLNPVSGCTFKGIDTTYCCTVCLAPSINHSLQVMSVTASQHAEVLERLESLNLLRDSNRLLREENTSLVDKV